MTEEQFVQWCDDQTWAEWIDGEVLLMSPVNIQHGELFVFLLRLLGDFVEHHDLGSVMTEPVHVRFAKLRRRRSPDIFFIASARQSIIRAQHIEGAPDLILEIVSPDSQSRDRREKFLEYQSAGVPEYWIIDPLSKTVEAYALASGKKYHPIPGKDRIPSQLLPGFFLKPAWLWNPKLPKVSACLREIKSAK
jgi:Uma2 family endonuclease